jgi:hypothetical protein
MKTIKPLKKKLNMIFEDGITFHYSWIGKIKIIKITILSKAMYRFNIIPIKIPKSFFTEKKSILKFMWRYKRSQIGQS